MRSIPVDERRMQLVVAVPPRQQSKANPVTGEVTWDVDLFVIADDRPDLLRVSVPDSGMPKGLSPSSPVQAAGLTAIAWDKDGRHGLMFRCESLRPLAVTTATGTSKQVAA